MRHLPLGRGKRKEESRTDPFTRFWKLCPDMSVRIAWRMSKSKRKTWQSDSNMTKISMPQRSCSMTLAWLRKREVFGEFSRYNYLNASS